jgi:hypothetical protein
MELLRKEVVVAEMVSRFPFIIFFFQLGESKLQSSPSLESRCTPNMV